MYDELFWSLVTFVKLMLLRMRAADLCDATEGIDMDECARHLRPCLALVHMAQAMLDRS
jgi:hypothetical protein